ncbi:Ig-like domain-containing protein, partial [Vibrio vulnificus]
SVDGGYTVRAKFNIARAPILVESVTVSPTSVTLEEGKTQRLTYTYLPANADNLDFYWISDDESVAVVSDNGLVTAIGDGETTVNVQYGVDSSIFD